MMNQEGDTTCPISGMNELYALIKEVEAIFYPIRTAE